MNDDIKTNDLNLANDSNNASEAAEGAQNEVTQERTLPKLSWMKRLRAV